jgi:hypothetical protein
LPPSKKEGSDEPFLVLSIPRAVGLVNQIIPLGSGMRNQRLRLELMNGAKEMQKQYFRKKGVNVIAF